MRVFVTDADNRIALSVIRALGHAGHQVTLGRRSPPGSARNGAAAARFVPICAASRYVSECRLLPSREEASAEEALIAATAGHEVLIPVSINEIFHALRLRAALESAGVALPFTDEQRLRRANAKDVLLPLAESNGLAVPWTQTPADAESVERVAAGMRAPLVLKLRDDEGLVLPPWERYAIAHTPGEFRAAHARLHAHRPWPLVQEFIDGEGYGVSVLCDHGGEPRATLAHRRIREYPPAGGPSACAESVEAPEAVSLAHRLLRVLGWFGVAMVEFRRERTSGRWVLMEVNPRFWGSLPLAEAAGVNFPDLLCRMAKGMETSARPPRPGVRMRFLFLDLLGAWQSARSGSRPEVVDGVLADLCNPRVRDGVWAWDDPRPGIRYGLTRLFGGPMTG
ncbi:MAG: ATP-grasp domain-containing protein [Planctomycetes bacterium]|nr:ATP-grasp domain-containing protein [Planctomycetota bacterium]